MLQWESRSLVSPLGGAKSTVRRAEISRILRLGVAMEFDARLLALADKVKQQRDSIDTEEATKNAFVMPFISTILGYDVFNPSEVVPEFTADVGVKKGEKVDYAIVHNGAIQILLECKKIQEPLKIEHASQLYRYFAVTSARIAILTNGEQYQFFTDLEAPNRMDSRPFLLLDLNDIDDTLIPELEKLSKNVFNLDSVLSAAGELKYIGEIKRIITNQFKDPDEDWVKYFAARVYEGSVTQRIRDQFAPLVTKATKQFLNDQVNDRLKVALGADHLQPHPVVINPTPNLSSTPDRPDPLQEISTTPEELDGYHIIRAILCSEVKASRITHRDVMTYFAVMLDNKKTIARLYFNRSQKYLGIFDAQKAETRIPINDLEEIYNYADVLRDTARTYL